MIRYLRHCLNSIVNLFIAFSLFCDEERILYLDCDTLVRGGETGVHI